MIFRSFGILFKKFLVIFPEGVLNIRTEAQGPDEKNDIFRGSISRKLIGIDMCFFSLIKLGTNAQISPDFKE